MQSFLLQSSELRIVQDFFLALWPSSTNTRIAVACIISSSALSSHGFARWENIKKGEYIIPGVIKSGLSYPWSHSEGRWGQWKENGL